MKIKTFQALTMTEALRTIREELGADAVILSTKSVKQQGKMFGLFGRTAVEVTAAIDFDPRHSDQPGHTSGERPSGGSSRLPQFQESFRSSMQQVSARTDRVSVSQETLSRPRTPTATMSPEPLPAETGGRPHDHAAPEWTQLAQEVRGLRDLIETTMQPRRAPRRVSLKRLPPSATHFYHDLVRAGIEGDTAEEVLAEATSMLQAGDDESDVALRRAVHRALARSIKVSGPLLSGNDQKKTVIAVGPTGVGKTTTIAKLAAHYTLKEQRSVSLITLDTYRVAAVEQLRMYAKVIGVTMDVALTKREALDFIRRRSKSELILIDTAGRSPMDEAGLRDLRDLVSLDHPLETHLVLSATTRESDLVGGVKGYAGIPINRLLFTKLDETRGYGGLFGLLRTSGLPLSYLSTGQNVPEDLEVAGGERVADLVLGSPLKHVRRETEGVKREA